MGEGFLRATTALTLACFLGGCVTAFDFSPVPAPAMRTAIEQANAGHPATVRDTSGTPRAVDRDTAIAYGDGPQALESSEGSQQKPADIANLCADPTSSGCPYSSSALTWEVGAPKKVVDWGAILGLGLPVVLVGGLVGGNIVCLGADDCASGVKTTVVVVDVVLLSLAAIALVVVIATAKNWDHVGD